MQNNLEAVKEFIYEKNGYENSLRHFYLSVIGVFLFGYAVMYHQVADPSLTLAIKGILVWGGWLCVWPKKYRITEYLYRSICSGVFALSIYYFMTIMFKKEMLFLSNGIWMRDIIYAIVLVATVVRIRKRLTREPVGEKKKPPFIPIMTIVGLVMGVSALQRFLLPKIQESITFLACSFGVYLFLYASIKIGYKYYLIKKYKEHLDLEKVFLAKAKS
jgi:hypothetical protein